MTPKAQSIGKKIGKLDFIKMKDFCYIKDCYGIEKKSHRVGKKITSDICVVYNMQRTCKKVSI
jgi:tetrahydromethanopterin S-methyltransferase subunit G